MKERKKSTNFCAVLPSCEIMCLEDKVDEGLTLGFSDCYCASQRSQVRC